MEEAKKEPAPQADRLERLEARCQVLREEVDELKRLVKAIKAGRTSASRRNESAEDW